MRPNDFSDLDLYLLHEGTHRTLYRKLGAHIAKECGASGVRFSLWAPNARSVSLLSQRGGWREDTHPMERTDGGIFTCFVPEMKEGEIYRFAVLGADGVMRHKSDPFAFSSELRPSSASVVCPLDRYEWGDRAYCEERSKKDPLKGPMAVYEVHLGSWKRDYGRNPLTGFLDYRTLADQLAQYVTYMGYTHVELIGIAEHPLDASWGYQVTGYYSPTSRYGTPDDLRYFVDRMHQSGIGVILDWVPAHFPKDSFGLADFDGTALYEYGDPLKKEFPEWGTRAFDLGKHEVRAFLLSNAFYWVREFHVDALRVDAVASILFSSFGKSEWRPNRYGGTESLEGIDFLRLLNHALSEETDAYLIAEDSSIMEGITRPVTDGGIGFRFKWNMGWMNDTLRYVKEDPIFRKWHHDKLTHSIDYAFLEHFMLVLSHDEVVHLKRSMLEKFPGRIEDKFGGLKTLYTYQMTHPGKKLLFMGQDFGETAEWQESQSINWALADHHSGHRDVLNAVRRLLTLYRSHHVLHDDTGGSAAFEWVKRSDAEGNTLCYIRRDPQSYRDALLVVLNFAPVEHKGYTCGVPLAGEYVRVFSTVDVGDSLPPSPPRFTASDSPCDGYPCSLSLDLYPYESAILALPTVTNENEGDGKTNPEA